MIPDLKRLLSVLSHPQAQWVGLRYMNEKISHRSVRDGKPEGNSTEIRAGVMVEVLAQGQFGYCATNVLTEKSIQAAFLQATTQAISASRFALRTFTQEQRPASKGEYKTKRKNDLSSVSAGDINILLVDLCATLKCSDLVVKTKAAVVLAETDSLFVSSSGADFGQNFSHGTVHLEAIAQKGDVVQKRTNFGSYGYSFQSGAELLNSAVLLAQATQVGAQAVELVSAENCASDNTTVVLAPDQMMLQIHESIGHPLELDRILGDERNYAGSSFVNLSDFGKLQYGSDIMNVTFDPTVQGEFASYAFDDSGNPAKREFLIQNGKLLAGLGSLESQMRSGVPGVANFRAASWNRAPIDRMANINLEPGVESFNDIISSVEKGIYMESNRSWSIDDYRNKFQFGCEYGRIIENGKLGKIVRNPNYRGVTANFWHNLWKVGNESTLGMYGTPFCGKGEPNQIIRVGHASPVCAFRDIEVFGGEQ